MSIDTSMERLLSPLKPRLEEIDELLSDPKNIADKSRYRELAKERSELVETLTILSQYRRVSKNVSDNETLIKEDPDSELAQIARDELADLEKTLTGLEQQLKVRLAPKDPADTKNVIVEIRAGTGGEEAALFVADLFRMYQRYAESRRWKIDVMNSHPTGVGGFKEVIFSVEGDDVYGDLKYESGVHRVQRVPVTEASGRIHTSAASVAVLPEAEEVELRIDPKDLKIDVFRSSGPGGQSVNTTDSAVRVTHIPTNTVVTCQDEKSQHKNKAKAMKVLRARLLDKLLTEQTSRISRSRKLMVGTGDRSEKIRTYNFPQNRLTDHRINVTRHDLQNVLEGHLHDLIAAAKNYAFENRIKSTQKDKAGV